MFTAGENRNKLWILLFKKSKERKRKKAPGTPQKTIKLIAIDNLNRVATTN